MQVDWFPVVVMAAMAAMTVQYVRKHRRHPPQQFVPVAAWLRAGIYFCFCYLMAWYSGALPAALTQPWATPQQLGSPIWQAWVLGLFVLITVGYWIIWARFTTHFERQLELLPQLAFGLLWGLAAGFLFLSFWYWVQMALPGLPVWGTWLVSYVIISIWQWLWQDYGWDVYISPEHDCPWSIMVKVPATHIPNVTLCLIFFALYDNHWIFVGLQTWALLGASIAMRMPSPWCQKPTLAANQVPGLFGPNRPRASGYIAPDITNDPYRRSTGLPAGTAIWVLGAHVLATLIPVFTLALVQWHMSTLQEFLFAPRLLLLAALLLMTAGALELARNSFKHHSYLPADHKDNNRVLFETLGCLAMATIISACFGQHTWVVIGSYAIAAAYPLGYQLKRGSRVPRVVLVILMTVALYQRFANPIVLLPLLTLFLNVYFAAVLKRTQAQSVQGLTALSSGFGMVVIPLAIYYSAHRVAIDLSQVVMLGAVVVIAALLAWPLVSRLGPTPNAHRVFAAPH